MEGRPTFAWKSALRTTVFAVLAALCLLVLTFAQLTTAQEKAGPGRAEIYRRGGDTFMGLYYLAHGAGMKEETADRFLLRQALAYYMLASEANSSEVEIQASLALVLRAFDRQRDARRVISRPLKTELSRQLRRELTAVFAIVVSTRASQREVDTAYRFLAPLGPGRMTLARAYESMGKDELAQEEWDKAWAEAQPVLRAVLVMITICGAMVLAGLIGLASAITLRLRRRGAEPVTEAAPSQAAWGAREALEALILWIFLQTACGILLAIVMPLEWELEVMPLMALSVGSGGVALLWVWLASGRRAKLGWQWRHAWRQLAIGISAVGLCALPVMAIHKIFQDLLGQGLADEPIVPLVLAGSGWQDKAALIAGACVAVPALEETVFRGVLFGALRRHWSFAPAAVVSAAAFAVGHLSFAGLVGYLALGLLFAYLYERGGSLLAPWAAHAAFNAFNLTILLTLFGQG